MNKLAYVLGAGGHAKVIVRALQDLGITVAAIFDDDPSRWNQSLFGVPIHGPVDRIRTVPRAPTVIAIGNNRVRKQLADRYDLPWMTVVHPEAFVDASVRIGAGSVVFARAVIQPDTRLGQHVIVNTAATIDHDCSIGDWTHIAPGVHLAGGVTIRDGVLVGIGAVAIPGTTVGAWATIGAGAAVVTDIPANTVAVGVPARQRSSASLDVAAIGHKHERSAAA